METRKQKFIRYIISAAYTFFSVAALTFTSDLLGIIDVGGTLDKAAVTSLLAAAGVMGFRAVAKLLGEWLKTMPSPVKLAGRLFKK